MQRTSRAPCLSSSRPPSSDPAPARRTPGPDRCENGTCVGKKIERQKTGEKIFEGDTEPLLRPLCQASAMLTKLTRFFRLEEPYCSVKVQSKKLDVLECCEDKGVIVENTGREVNIIAEFGGKTKGELPFTSPLGTIAFTITLKMFGSGKGFYQHYEVVCLDSDRCDEKYGGQGALVGETAYAVDAKTANNDNLLTIDGTGRITGSLSFTKQCGPIKGILCGGPLSLRYRIKILGFVQYSNVYIVPGTSGCTESE